MPPNDLLAAVALQHARVDQTVQNLLPHSYHALHDTSLAASALRIYPSPHAEVDADVHEIRRQLDVVRRVLHGFAS